MNDLVLGIRLTADGKNLTGEVREARSQIDSLNRMAKQANTESARAAETFTAGLRKQAETLGFTRSQTLAYEASQHRLTDAQRRSVEQSIRAIDAFDRKEKVMRRLQLAGAALGTALGAALVTSFRGMIREAAEAEQAGLRLEAVLKATGHAAGLNRHELDALAESMQRRLGFADDQVRESMAVLLTFRSVSRESFGDALEVAANLSRVMGTDLKSSMLQLGRALEDPTTGLTALRRSGVSFTDAQQEAIKAMVETGRQVEAITAILQAMKSQGLDKVAEAMNKGLFKATNDLRNSWSDLLETLGRTSVVKGPVETVLGSLRDYLTDMKNVIESGTWFEQLAFFTRGYSSQRIVDLRDRPAFDAAQDARELARGDVGGSVARRLAAQREAEFLADLGQKNLKALRERELKEELKEDEERARKLARFGQLLSDAGPSDIRDAAAREEREIDARRARQIEELSRIRREAAAEAADLDRQAQDRLQQMEREEKRFQDGLEDRWNELARGGKDAIQELQGAIEGWGRDISRELGRMAVDGELSFRRLADSARDFLGELVAIQLQRRVIDPALKAGTGFIDNLLSGLFHAGGIVGAGGGSVRAVPPWAFVGAPRLHGGGVIGAGEVPAILRRGEGVFTPEQMRALGGSKVTVNIIEGPGTRTRVSERSNNQGGIEIDVIVEQLEGRFERNISRGGGLANILERRYGLSPAAGAVR